MKELAIIEQNELQEIINLYSNKDIPKEFENGKLSFELIDRDSKTDDYRMSDE